MARACFDPREAISFWKRMDRTQQAAPPQFLSTHPLPQSRIENLQKHMPAAVERFHSSECQQGYDGVEWKRLFQRAFV